jgi:glyoxylase-like metal-dependent hydrolase (beta-lactamase superfamily II)
MERGRGAIDLGGRIVDVLAIPGHDPTHVAFYDRETRLLFSGDTLYPGRVYVRDWAAFRESIERLVAFVDDGHPIAHVIGSHVELSAAGEEYPEGTSSHGGEHPLALGEEHLRDLLATMNALAARPARTKRPGYVVVPVF